jgi:Family of unknown function (DUF6496)
VALGRDFLGSLQFYPWRERMVITEEEAIERTREDAQEGKSASTQAGEFVREEIEHVREGKHGARSPQQAIAIGLSKARRAGIKLPPPRRGSVSAKTRRQAARDSARGRAGRRHISRTRSRANSNALRRESHRTASHSALSRQARSSARRRGSRSRHAAARKAVRTKGRSGIAAQLERRRVPGDRGPEQRPGPRTTHRFPSRI